MPCTTAMQSVANHAIVRVGRCFDSWDGYAYAVRCRVQVAYERGDPAAVAQRIDGIMGFAAHGT